MLLNSDLNVGNNLDGEYEFLKDLGLIEDGTEIKIGDDDANDEFGTGDDTDDDDEFVMISKKMMIAGILVDHILGMII